MTKMYEIYVGIDDTDSPEGMCTTYITCVIIDELKYCGFKVEGHPRLIRLNPFARFKTRGNGATSFKMVLDSINQIEKAKKIILKKVEELSCLENENTNPGVVFYQGAVNQKLESFALKAIRSIITIKEAKSLAEEIGADFYCFKKGRGIIGALSAIGCPLNDITYELLSYRQSKNYCSKRRINPQSVKIMDQKTYPQTFDNLDGGYMAIEPHTPCPILYGIRGESPEAVLEAHNLVEIDEPLDRYCIFKTNQHTDIHLQKIKKISEMEKFGCYIASGEVEDMPWNIEGGHVFFKLKDDSGSIQCAAYEPTKDFRKLIKKLRPGDHITVYGGIGSQGTLNLEKIQIKSLAPEYIEKNPLCDCGKRMKSAGSGKGYKCPRCGKKIRSELKLRNEIARDLKTGFYEVPPSARRHLSKPLIRMNIKI